MAVFKLSTLFNLTTALSNPSFPIHRSAGWSETIYGNFTSVQAALAEANRTGSGFAGAAGLANGLWPSRAALLPLGAAIVGFRIQQVDVPGPVQTGVLNYPGILGVETDIPQMALLMRSPGLGVNNIRRFTLRCIPDAQITEGEYQPTMTFNTLVNLYITSLAAWAFRARSPTGTKFRIINVTAAGAVTTEVAHNFVVNQMVRVTKTRDSGGNLRGGRFQVASIGPGATLVTLYNWPFGATTVGSIQGDPGVTYPNIDTVNTVVSRTVTRRVGRPFVGYRGRRSKRR